MKLFKLSFLLTGCIYTLVCNQNYERCSYQTVCNGQEVTSQVQEFEHPPVLFKPNKPLGYAPHGTTDCEWVYNEDGWENVCN